MLRLGILFCLLALGSSISQEKNETHTFEGLSLPDTKLYPESCADVAKLEIRVPGQEPFSVSCDQHSQGGGWTIILRRIDGSENFHRGWEDYKNGFGQLANEFFLGLDRIHAMTASEPQELLVLLEDYEGNQRFVLYDEFIVGSEATNYTLISVGSASGDGGDSLTYQLGMKFSTKDRDNDEKTGGIPCAIKFTGAWWYKTCHESNLCGKYGDDTFGKGITWSTFKGFYYSLKRATMMIRPKSFIFNYF